VISAPFDVAEVGDVLPDSVAEAGDDLCPIQSPDTGLSISAHFDDGKPMPDRRLPDRRGEF